MTRVVDALLRYAAGRWPAEHRDEAAREWAAEVHEIRRTGARGNARALRFAASLAVARAPESGLPDQLATPGLVRAALPALLFLCAPQLCALVVLLAAGAAQPVIDALRSRTNGSTPDVAGNVVLLALACAATAVLGRALGSRSAVRAAPPRFTAVVLAALLTAGTGAAAAPIALDQYDARELAGSLLVWLPTLALACLLAVRRRRLVYPVLVALAGVYLTVEVFTRLVPYGPGLLDPQWYDSSVLLWSPVTLLPQMYYVNPGTPLSHEYLTLLPVLLLATAAFAVGYLRAASTANAGVQPLATRAQGLPR